MKESENRFCVSLLNRSIQDLSDHGASKAPKNLLPDWILRNAKSIFGFFQILESNLGFS